MLISLLIQVYMQGIECNIATLLTIIFVTYVKVAFLLLMEDQMYLAARRRVRKASDSVCCEYWYSICSGCFNGRVV